MTCGPGPLAFEQFQADLSISRKVLTERLNHLVERGVLERRPYHRRPRYGYVLRRRPPSSSTCFWSWSAGETTTHTPCTRPIASSTRTAIPFGLPLTQPGPGTILEQPADRAAALRWLDAERPVLLAAQRLAAAAGLDLHAGMHHSDAGAIRVKLAGLDQDAAPSRRRVGDTPPR
jgi:hypothetical protein